VNPAASSASTVPLPDPVERDLAEGRLYEQWWSLAPLGQHFGVATGTVLNAFQRAVCQPGRPERISGALELGAELRPMMLESAADRVLWALKGLDS
jgi:hypothetical protein